MGNDRDKGHDPHPIEDESSPAPVTQSEAFNNLKPVDFEEKDHSGRQLIFKNLQDLMDGGGPGFFLVVGIDRLSFFNEAFGLKYADTLIHETGQRLKRILGERATITHIYGDVYGVIYRALPTEKIAVIAAKVLSRFYERPLRTDMGPIRIGVSIGGISLAGKDLSPVSIVTKAEFALRMAKDQGRGCFVAYEDTMMHTQNYRTMLVTGDTFLKALKEQRVKLAFQPVIDSRSGAVSFHECLVRIMGKDGSLMLAAEFIPAVEELGLARMLDQYTMYAAIEELKIYPSLKLSVNVSNWSLSDTNWVHDVIHILKDKPYVASRLIVEITETTAMLDIEKTKGFIADLKNLGCRIALDDFGAGYTAFSQLQNLDIDIVKIDQSFIRNIKEDNNQLFVQALQTLASGIHIETVGEGAESEETVELLRRGGVDHIQGFIYGKPSTERLWLPHDHRDRFVQ